MRTSRFALAAIVTAAFAQKPVVDFANLGPAVGSAMPSFSAVDQNGKTRTLASLLGPKGAILVFFRSADW
jgi:hypothetical protein